MNTPHIPSACKTGEMTLLILDGRALVLFPFAILLPELGLLAAFFFFLGFLFFDIALVISALHLQLAQAI
jgi:hypothetical protein